MCRITGHCVRPWGGDGLGDGSDIDTSDGDAVMEVVVVITVVAVIACRTRHIVPMLLPPLLLPLLLLLLLTSVVGGTEVDCDRGRPTTTLQSSGCTRAVRYDE